MTDSSKEQIEAVARAVRKARFERNGHGKAYDPELPLHPTELADAEAALAALPSPEREPLREALERALRIRIWNECKERGMRDEDAYKRINAEIEGIKTQPSPHLQYNREIGHERAG